MSEEIEGTIRKFALQNAVFFKGKANPKAVVGKILGGCPELRPRAAEITPLIEQIVEEVNSMGLEAQTKALQEMDASLLVKEKKERKYELPDLQNVDGKVTMRIAPGPSGPLHIGHTRVSVLNDEYVKRYGGDLILRFEDTNPEKIDPDAYDMIPEDLDWLGVKCTKTYIQSERFQIYYDYTRRLIEQGNAYVCTCDGDRWRELKEKKTACPCRDLPVETQLERYDGFMEGKYSDGEAVVVVKTDIAHPNPAVRDFVALRLVSHPHPRTGSKYIAYPMMNLSVAIDDHEMGMTHVIRGKDHLNNTFRQEYADAAEAMGPPGAVFPDPDCFRRGRPAHQEGTVRHDRRGAADCGARPADGLPGHISQPGEYAGGPGEAEAGQACVHGHPPGSRHPGGKQPEEGRPAGDEMGRHPQRVPPERLHLSVCHRGEGISAAGRAGQCAGFGGVGLPGGPSGRGKMQIMKNHEKY